jgi:ribosome biogenesis GTPase A
VDQSDIILLVLDARDPEGCRSRLVEEEVRRRESEGKKLVFVLNKIGKLFKKLPVYIFPPFSPLMVMLVVHKNY